MASSSVQPSPPSTPPPGLGDSFLFEYEGNQVFLDEAVPHAIQDNDNGALIRYNFASAKKFECFTNNDELGVY
jgi:hypothetical protein